MVDIDQQIDEKEKEILKAEQDRDKVEEAINILRLEIDHLRIKIREHQAYLIKSLAVIRDLKHAHKELTRQYWKR